MKISYVHGICVRHDAISAAIRHEVSWLSQRHAVAFFGFRCDFDDMPFRRVETLADVAFDAWFQSSDVVIFHFGVFYPLFDLLPVVPTIAHRIVVFHNITPKQFVSETHHDVIDRSFRQIANMAFADHVVCDSQTNLDVLRNAGIHVPATVIPLAIELEEFRHHAKPSAVDGVVRIAFVGRFVRSKGPADLVEAVALLIMRNLHARLRIDLVGNIGFSDPAVVQGLREAIAELAPLHRERLVIEMHGDADDATKKRILVDADLFVLPTYHEGFCVPILEALACDCQIVAYDNSNVPHVAGGFAALVPTGDVDALSVAIEHRIAELGRREFHRTAIAAHLDAFAVRRVRERFVRHVEAIAARAAMPASAAVS